jgi:hypothetical protein
MARGTIIYNSRKGAVKAPSPITNIYARVNLSKKTKKATSPNYVPVSKLVERRPTGFGKRGEGQRRAIKTKKNKKTPPKKNNKNNNLVTIHALPVW